MQIKGGVPVVLYLAVLVLSGSCDGVSESGRNDIDDLAVLGALSICTSFLYGLYLAIAARVRSERDVLRIALAMIVMPIIAAILAAVGGVCASIAKGLAVVVGVLAYLAWMSSC